MKSLGQKAKQQTPLWAQIILIKCKNIKGLVRVEAGCTAACRRSWKRQVKAALSEIAHWMQECTGLSDVERSADLAKIVS